jgi:hypothetical protein
VDHRKRGIVRKLGKNHRFKKWQVNGLPEFRYICFKTLAENQRAFLFHQMPVHARA